MAEQAQVLPSGARLRSVTASMMPQQQWPMAWLDSLHAYIYVCLPSPHELLPGSSGFSGSKGPPLSCLAPLTSSGVSPGCPTLCSSVLEHPHPPVIILPFIYPPPASDKFI